MRFLPLTILLAACGLSHSQGADTAEPSSNGNSYYWGEAGSDDGADTTTDDSGDTDSGGTTDSGDADDSGDDVDSGSTTDTAAEDLKATAKVWIYPDAEYDVSSSNYGHSTPSICMFDVVVDSEFPSNYGACAATSSTNAYMADPVVEFIPGSDLTIQAKWTDSIRDRYYAEKSGVVNAIEERIVIEFPDGTWQGYVITGSEPTAPGQAGWTENGDGTGGEVHVWTFEDTLDHHDR